MPILCYIIFNRERYTSYEGSVHSRFLAALRGHPVTDDMRYYVTAAPELFLYCSRASTFLSGFFAYSAAIPLFLLPGFILAVGRSVMRSCCWRRFLS